MPPRPKSKPDAFAGPPLGEMKRAVWPLSKIHPYPNNPRTHPPAQVALLAELLKRYGPDQDIVVDEDGVILKGHGRRLAALLAELREFPVTQRLGLSEADKTAMRIQDNQVSLLAGWDQELVRGEIASLKTAGFEVGLLGFGEAQLVQFLGIMAQTAPRLRIQPLSRQNKNFVFFNGIDHLYSSLTLAWRCPHQIPVSLMAGFDGARLRILDYAQDIRRRYFSLRESIYGVITPDNPACWSKFCK